MNFKNTIRIKFLWTRQDTCTLNVILIIILNVLYSVNEMFVFVAREEGKYYVHEKCDVYNTNIYRGAEYTSK